MNKRSKPRAPSFSKISVTVERIELNAARAAARREKRSLSSVVSEALALRRRREGLLALVAEHEVTHGVISEDEMQAADQLWPG
ncbi:MAG: hypothetical protein ISP90_13340 [Nevskia sp.]|nr:hypothetical protein [Nevskia sp.]